MEGSKELIGIKMKIKTWERNFLKNVGRTPTRNDINNDEKAKAWYINYSQLKKEMKENFSKSNAECNTECQPAVWGDALLKSSATVSMINTNSEEFVSGGKSNSISKAIHAVNYRDKFRKNLGAQPLSSEMRRKVNCKKRADIKHAISPPLLNEQSDCKIMAEGDKLLSPPTVASNRCVKQAAAKTAHQVDIAWLDKQEEDLSDLLNLSQDPSPPVNEKDESVIHFQVRNTDVDQTPTVTQATSPNQSSKSNMCENFASSSEPVRSILVPRNNELPTENISFFVQSVDVSDESMIETVIGGDISPEVGFQGTAPHISNSGSKRTCGSNFVRLNMKKKCFAKKGKSQFLRRQVFKEKMAKKGICVGSGWKGRRGGKKGFSTKSEDKCFKCGNHGHWAADCKAIQNRAKDLYSERNAAFSCTQGMMESAQMGSKPTMLKIAQPLFGESTCDSNCMLAFLKKFGYSEFREGQEKAVRRILCGLSTLLVLPTGLGKSLCYQLPAHMYALKQQSITLIVSPLISLMDDQVQGLPKFLSARRIHSGMKKEQRQKILADINDCKIDILLISPETLMSWAGMPSCVSPLMKLPPISFACIDECHCLSEWSHSFRPSYFRVCQVLRAQLGVKCIVGLTATATVASCKSIANQLGITNFNDGVIMKTDLPSNLRLTVSRDKHKDEALELLLSSKRFGSLSSIIIYCTRREETARIAAYLRTRLQSSVSCDSEARDDLLESAKQSKRTKTAGASSKRRAVSVDAECYHAGLSPSERERIQKRFMSGKLKIVVATVAFGMGIDKQDLRGIIHYNMPQSFERYVQEIGRAGRDGLPAHCHLFLDGDGSDLYELSRHVYAKTVDKYVIKQLAATVFTSCHCAEISRECTGHLVSIPIDDFVMKLDISKEGIETVLCYLELDGLIDVYLPTEANCTLHCYEGPAQLETAAKKCPAVGVALSHCVASKTPAQDLTFSLAKVADALDTDIRQLKLNLMQLTWDTSLSKDAKATGKSGIVVEFSDTSFLLKTKCQASHEFLDTLTDKLHKCVVEHERKGLSQLKATFDKMHEVSFSNVGYCMESVENAKSDRLKSEISDYFKTERDYRLQADVKLHPDVEDDIRSTVRQFLCVHGNDLEGHVTGRAIARIFHGIDSPRFPAKTWGPARRFWRCKLTVDFNAVVKIATSELVKFR